MLGYSPGTGDELLALLGDRFHRPTADHACEAGDPFPPSGARRSEVVPGPAGASAPPCALCALRTWSRLSESLAGSAAIAYQDDELAALVVGGRLGVLLLPRRHVRSLSPSPAASAVILAALRRTVRAVESSCQAVATIEPRADVANASGHVAYWAKPIPTAPPIAPSTRHPTALPRSLAAGSEEQTEALLRALAENFRPLRPIRGPASRSFP
jgi:hypothetical protein